MHVKTTLETIWFDERRYQRLATTMWKDSLSVQLFDDFDH
uniref:Oxidoreductase n=1 Tax=Heterorhabditis bacteriophora TaxID=37862 RepID=A0A1I7WE75_HETBA